MEEDAAAPLPMLGPPPERADAALNRERILCAARALLDRGGADALRMDAVAAEAGVGKGTVFRRFGDRAGLTAALVDEAMRRFQDAFLHGPPPLGPGAAPAERLEAFMTELVRFQVENRSLAALMETPPGRTPPPATGTLLLHAAELVREVGAPGDPAVLAAMLVNAVAPSALERADADLARAQAGVATLVRGLTAQAG